jgi:phosphate:Na+ symporter
MFYRNVDFDDVNEKVGAQDDKIDILEKAVRFYLAKLSQKSLTEEQAKLEMALLTIAADLEDVGDLITKEMLQLAKKKSKKLLIFSEEGGRRSKNST